jgi:hypothetical protein
MSPASQSIRPENGLRDDDVTANPAIKTAFLRYRPLPAIQAC